MCGMSKHCWCRSERERNWCDRVTKGVGVCECVSVCVSEWVCAWETGRKSWAKYYLLHDCERRRPLWRERECEWERGRERELAKLKRRLLLFAHAWTRLGVCVCVCVCMWMRTCAWVRVCGCAFVQVIVGEREIIEPEHTKLTKPWFLDSPLIDACTTAAVRASSGYFFPKVAIAAPGWLAYGLIDKEIFKQRIAAAGGLFKAHLSLFTTFALVRQLQIYQLQLSQRHLSSNRFFSICSLILRWL